MTDRYPATRAEWDDETGWYDPSVAYCSHGDCKALADGERIEGVIGAGDGELVEVVELVCAEHPTSFDWGKPCS
jgi:hypothetical protein